MQGFWGKWAALALLTGMFFGCRTPQPVVKPKDGPEAFNVPPNQARFNTPAYPQEALQKDDPTRRLRLDNTNPLMPAGGNSPNTMGGMGMGPGR